RAVVALDAVVGLCGWQRVERLRLHGDRHAQLEGQDALRGPQGYACVRLFLGDPAVTESRETRTAYLVQCCDDAVQDLLAGGQVLGIDVRLGVLDADPR